MKKIAALVLGCASGNYPELINTIRRTWGRKRFAGVDIYYLFGRVTGASENAAMEHWFGGRVPDVGDDKMYQKGNMLLAGCADSIHEQADCILQKRLIAFDFLTSANEYDCIYTVCAASYVDQAELVSHVERMSGTHYISGVTSIDRTGRAPFVSGASMLLSAAVAAKIAICRAQVRSENTFGFRDDVAIGQWIANHMCSAPIENIIHAIANSLPQPEGSLFHPAPHTTADFVIGGKSKFSRQTGMFHYHFHSAEPKTLEAFHYRYFLT
jgi:hypothetical protein